MGDQAAPISKIELTAAEIRPHTWVAVHLKIDNLAGATIEMQVEELVPA